MAKIKSWFNCDLQHAVQVQALNGNVFSMDNNGNQICVRIFDGGEKAVISATVTARCILADGSTVNLNGSLTSVNSQSVAVVDIPQSVLLIPGTLKISVQLTASSVVATIAAIITTVYATKTDNVITPSSQVISDWNAEISSQLASAVKFSSQSLTDAQKLQARTNIGAASTADVTAEETARSTADTTLQGNIDAEAATRAAADADLNSALKMVADGGKDIDITGYSSITCVVSGENTLTRSANKYKSYQFAPDELWGSIEITANQNYQTHVTFVTEALPTTPDTGTDITSLLCNGETGRHIILKGETGIFTIPSDCADIVIAYTSNSNNVLPSKVTVYTSVGDDVDELKKDVENKLDKMITSQIDWKTFATEDNPLGWQTGYYSRNGGGTGTSKDYMRTVRGQSYIAKSGEQKLTFTVPSGYHAQISEYEEDGTYVDAYGNSDSGTNIASCSLTEGHKYRFTVGGFSNNSDTYLTELFIATIIGTVGKTFVAWQQEQDNRIAALEQEEIEIPDYYFTDGYLPGKADEITRIQNMISEKQDSFFFVTDFHHQHNAGNSLALIRYLKKRTGITKLFFGGDAGGAYGTSATAIYHRLQQSASAWEDLANCVDDFRGVLGNHEWIHTGTVVDSYTVANLAGMNGAYLNRFKNNSVGMDAETGSYYIDNIANKIRYFFIQDTISSYPISGSIKWFGDRLMEVPEDYSICLVVHYAYVPIAATHDEYDGFDPEYNYLSIRQMSELLSKCHSKTDVTIGDNTFLFSTLTGVRHIIGIFSGHIHHGYLYDVDNPVQDASGNESIKGVAVFRGNTDCLLATSVGVDRLPWYWEDGIVGGTKIVREKGTVTEQCFYAVQIDLENKMLYITAIGGDHDWSGAYEEN